MSCVDSDHLTDPRDIAIKRCQDEARPYRGTPQWAEHLKPCMKAVMDTYMTPRAPGPFPDSNPK